MHHYRGTLFKGDRVHLDPANVYVQYHVGTGDHDRGWYGYLLVGSEADVEPGGTYSLKLSDGRSGVLEIETVAASDSGEVRATFYGQGTLG
jgi:hypothetical protein